MRHILYIPGLGDAKPTNFITDRWSNPNRELTVFDTDWASDEPYSEKYSRLIDAFRSIGNGPIDVIAQSAGGSLAVRLLFENPEIRSAHLVSSKILGSKGIGDNFQRRAPALLEAVKKSESLLENPKVIEDKTTIYRPIIDNVVPLEDMIVGDAKRRRIPAFTHAMGIGVALIFYLP